MDKFNWYVKSVILRISEAHDLGDVDRYALYERTKTLLAAPPATLTVNEKNQRQYRVSNVTGVIFTTNHRTDSLYLPADDRRHFVVWSEATKENFTTAYWHELYDWYDKQGGCEHVAAYLATRKLEAFNATAPPEQTEAFWAIVHADQSPDDTELADVIDKLGKPVALTIASVATTAEGGLGDFLRDRRNARATAHKMERAGYISVRNDSSDDGCWVICGRRQRVYARRRLSLAQRKGAAAALRSANGVLSELAAWAAKEGLDR
jgi:hypothetical protein